MERIQRFAAACTDAVHPAIFAILANLLFTLMDLIAQLLQNVEDVPVSEIVFVRMAGTSAIVLTYLYAASTTHAPLGPPGVRTLLWTRGLVALISVHAGYVSYAFISLSEAITIFSLRPFVVALLCCVYLGEPISRSKMLACVVSLLGVVLIAFPQILGTDQSSSTTGSHESVPTAEPHRLLGIALQMASFIAGGIEIFLVRAIGDRAEAPQILASYAAWGTILPPLLAVLRVPGVTLAWPRSWAAWALLAAIVPCGAAAQLTLTVALQKLPGVDVALIAYSGVVMSVIVQWLAYGTYPSYATFIGMAIIVLAGIAAIRTDPVTNEKSGEEAMSMDEADVPLMNVNAEGHV